MLTDKPNGTFLCRPAGREPLKEGGIHVYTVHVVKYVYTALLELPAVFVSSHSIFSQIDSEASV